MTAAMRGWALAAAALGAVAAAAALTREVALAASDKLVWSLPHWWSRLTEGPAYVSWLAGAAAVLIAAACVLAVVRLARGPAVEAGSVVVGEGDRLARVRTTALEHALAVILERRVPELSAVRVSVSAAARRVAVRALVEARPHGLTSLHGRAAVVVVEELRRVAGLELAGLELEVVRFTASDKEAA